MKNTFERIGDIYDLMIPWESRLAREEPFFRKIMGNEPAGKKILDAACGTGRHALMFRNFGHEVWGSDISLSSISVARKIAEEKKSDVFFINADLLNPGSDFSENMFDFVTILGNSVEQFVSDEDIHKLFSFVRSILISGGLFIFQILNFEASSVANDRFPAFRSANFDGKEIIFQKVFDVSNDKVILNLLIYKKEGGIWERIHESSELRPWKEEEISRHLKESGFIIKNLYGNYSFSKFSRFESRDLIVIAEKKA